MYRLLLLAFSLSITSSIMATGDENDPQSVTSIRTNEHSTHIARIAGDSIMVITGTTYSFTVDTPEDKGLVSTNKIASEFLYQLSSTNGTLQTYQILDKDGAPKTTAHLTTGDQLLVTAQDGKANKTYIIIAQRMALSGLLTLDNDAITVNTQRNITLSFTAGQRSPAATVRLSIPAGVDLTISNTTVNVIGRGEVALKDLWRQSIGRVGSKYSYSKVGEVLLTKQPDGSTLLEFQHLDLRPANGPDLVIVIHNVNLRRDGDYPFRVQYTTSAPEVLTSAGTGREMVVLRGVRTISDFKRVVSRGIQYKDRAGMYTAVDFTWSALSANSTGIHLVQSVDNGKNWRVAKAMIDTKKNKASISGLSPNKLHMFRLEIKNGDNKGFSNIASFYSGKMKVQDFGVSGKDSTDDTGRINEAISFLHQLGGGTLLFTQGVYHVRTVHLASNVYLYIEKDAVIKALKNGDEPEPTWFSDRKYRSGLSPTDMGPYADPENYLTKQDVGHHYFRNAMFFGERLDNVKIIGNGRITGDGNLVTGDRVMNNAAGNRCDKMFTFKLCTNIEIGGIYRSEDLWYDATKDAPYYIGKKGEKITDADNMLHIDRGGHFVLLATGSDNIHVHNTWFGKYNTSNARDIYDFMQCNNVTVTNIYSKVSSDDIVKPGSDCSLGFTRPARNYKVRNIIGDTNCNLFQIGSETADDIMDIHVDNIYILGANKAGFSISTNDGGHIKDIHLNCGHTGVLHSRSKMYRSFAPFFISISNRGRVLGAEAGRYAFTDNGEKHNELLIKNINIGQVENIILNGIDVYEVYAGSSYNGTRWKSYDGTQKRATPIIAGYSLPDPANVEGGLDFKLPNGRHTGYISNIVFNDVHVLVKGGNPASDTLAAPPELGVGQYNASNLRVQPSYGLWARHVKGLTVNKSSFNYEKKDLRHVIFLDDVIGATISSVKMVKPGDNIPVVKLKSSSAVSIDNSTVYENQWGQSPTALTGLIWNR
jgi:polygalacturonase